MNDFRNDKVANVSSDFKVWNNVIYLWIVFVFALIAPGLFKQRPPLSITTSGPLLTLHEEVEALLFLSEGKPYLIEVSIHSKFYLT